LRLPAVTALAVIPVTGLAVTAAATAALNWAGLWLPIPLLLSIAGAVAVSAVVHAGRRRSFSVAWPAALSPDRWRVTAPYLWIVAALCGWAVALPGMADAPDSLFGLLFTGTGPALVAVSAVILAAFVVA
ncbi:hypothetical protein C6A85_75205, partial [Mycobacterium sp. ITM-2017-0098]